MVDLGQLLKPHKVYGLPGKYLVEPQFGSAVITLSTEDPCVNSQIQ